MNEQMLDDKILDEATEWFVRMAGDDISQARAAEFTNWLSENPRHQAAYLEIGGLWDDLSVLERAPKTAVIESFADHKARKETTRPKIPAKYFWSPKMIAASIIFFVVGIIGYGYSDSWLTDSYTTRIGQLADVVLDDGSHLVLNTNSKVRVDLEGGQRLIYLDHGEVFFEVARDESRPFYVETPGGLVRVLGTKFNIRQKGSASDVTVLEGSVGVVDYGSIGDDVQDGAVSEMKLDATLAPGQKFTLGNDNVENIALAVDSKAVLSWRDRKLIYNGEKFSTLVADINRYYEAEIRIGDLSLNDIEVVAILKIEDQATTLKAIETTFNVTARPVSPKLIYLYPNK